MRLERSIFESVILAGSLIIRVLEQPQASAACAEELHGTAWVRAPGVLRPHPTGVLPLLDDRWHRLGARCAAQRSPLPLPLLLLLLLAAAATALLVCTH